jgi:hypothetical protein
MPKSAYDITAFWSRQFEEHLLFLSQMLVDPALKAEAMALHASYGLARSHALEMGGNGVVAQIEVPTRQVRAFKQKVLDRQLAGEMVGFNFPTFTAHTIKEVDLWFCLVLGEPCPDGSISVAVTKLGAEHALFGAHLLDVSERKLVAEANAAADGLYALAQAEQTPDTLGKEANAELDLLEWLKTNRVGSGEPGAPLSVISPMLAKHVAREQEEFARLIIGG